VRDRVLLNPIRVNTPLEDPRICSLASNNSSPRTGVLLNEDDMSSKGTRVAVEEGGKDMFILMGYKEYEPGE